MPPSKLGACSELIAKLGEYSVASWLLLWSVKVILVSSSAGRGGSPGSLLSEIAVLSSDPIYELGNGGNFKSSDSSSALSFFISLSMTSALPFLPSLSKQSLISFKALIDFLFWR